MVWIQIYLLIAALSSSVILCSSEQFKIGVILPDVEIFGVRRAELATAMMAAMDAVNERKGPEDLQNNFTLTLSVSAAPPSPSKAAYSSLIASIAEKVVAVIAPFHIEQTQLLAYWSGLANIPLLSPTVPRQSVRDAIYDPRQTFFSMKPHNLFGGVELLTDGILDYFNWKDVALLESNSKEARHTVLHFTNFATRHAVSIIVNPKIDQNETCIDKIATALEEIRDSGVTVIVTALDHNVNLYGLVFRQASEKNLIGPDIAWVCLLAPDGDALVEGLDNETLALMEGIIATSITVAFEGKLMLLCNCKIKYYQIYSRLSHSFHRCSLDRSYGYNTLAMKDQYV